MDKLLPCPFCGSDGILEAKVEETTGNLEAGTNISLPWSQFTTFYHVRCTKCYCQLDAGWKTVEQIKAQILELSAGQPITRENYRYFADQTIPRNNCPVREARHEGPGIARMGDIYLEAESLNTPNSWLDMACYRAAINQNKLVAEGRE